MSQYEKQGYLFPNKQKYTGNIEDFKGKITIEGVQYRLSGFYEAAKFVKGKLIALKAETEEDYQARKAGAKKKPTEKDYAYNGPVDLGDDKADIQGVNPEISDIPF
jgi:hypothetical protein